MSTEDDKRAVIRREMAAEDLYYYSRLMFKRRRGYNWVQAPHHPVVCDALMRVYRGECPRLIINIPPRYSKTELAVINFMSWALGKTPDAEFIHTSYGSDLAVNNSWQTRELVQSEAYHEIFPNLRLRADSSAKNDWRTTEGGIVYAVGLGGTITGFGAGKMRESFGGAIIIDDPHKVLEARSEVQRKNVIDWFQGTLETRKNSLQTPIILIMQRVHEEDLSGFLLAGGNGEHWEHVCLPALRPDGTALWPEKHTVKALRLMEEAAPYTFAGQYQQRPAPAEGAVFKPDKIRIVDALPDNIVEWYRGWDLAASDNEGDWTAGVRIGRTLDGYFVIAHVRRLRGAPEEVDKALTTTAELDGFETSISIPQDPGQAGKSQVAYIGRLLAGYVVSASPESGDKVTRAEPFAAQVNLGNVSMLRGEWNQAYIDEMRNFPNGKNDDQVDASSRAFMHLIEDFDLSTYLKAHGQS